MPTHPLPHAERAGLLRTELDRVLKAFANSEREERERGGGLEEINELHRANIEEAYRTSSAGKRADAHTRSTGGSSRRSDGACDSPEPDSGPSARDFPAHNAACDGQKPYPDTDQRATRPQTAFGRYRERWQLVRAHKGIRTLRFHELPWPIPLPNTTPAIVVTPADITEANVFAFYSQHDEPTHEDFKKMIRQELRVWHPDKLLTLMQTKLVSVDLKAVVEASQCITRSLFELLKLKATDQTM